MGHGGDIYTNGILVGKELIDFSSNINPFGIPNSFRDNIEEAVNNSKVYPDILYRRAREDICNYLNINSHYFYPRGDYPKLNFKSEDILLGNGASEIIEKIIATLNSVCIVVPSFSEYEISAKNNNVSIEYSYLDSDMKIDYEDLKKKIKKVDGIIIGNPNNPNGDIVNKDKLIPLLEFANENNKKIIVDEAFIEFTGREGYSVLELAKQYKCLIIIRALTKFYGLPGIRFGYSICKDGSYNNSIREKQLPWNINTFALLAIKYVLKDSKYINTTLDWIDYERHYIAENLKDITYIDKIYKSRANFLLIKPRGITSKELYNKLLNMGILIRVCNNYINLDENHIRVAIKSREDNEKLLQGFLKIEKEVFEQS